MTITSNISIVNVTSATGHPNMFLNQSEIEDIKEKVMSNREPWKTAYERLMSEADSSLSTPIQSVTYGGITPPTGDIHDYWAGTVLIPDPDRTDYRAAIKLGKSVRALGISYALTGDSRYADKAVQLINAWTVTPSTRMNPRFTPGPNNTWVNVIEYYVTFPGMFYGADLIWNYPGWNSADKDEFKSWAKDLISSSGRNKPSNPQNYENWRTLFISSAAVVADDYDTLNWVSNYWKELIPLQMDSQGKMIRELERHNSLSYSLYAIGPMIQAAEIARHHGTDLYNYRLADGRSLELALDFHAPYVAGKKSWPYPQRDTYAGENAALYELAYSFKQKSPYMDVINKWGRPMYEGRTMGPVTLTHGV